MRRGRRMTAKQYADCWKILRGQATPSLLETMNAIEHLVEIGMIENEKCDYSKCNEKAEIKGYIYREENGRKTEDTYDVQGLCPTKYIDTDMLEEEETYIHIKESNRKYGKNTKGTTK